MVSVRMKKADGRNNKMKNDISGFIIDTPLSCQFRERQQYFKDVI